MRLASWNALLFTLLTTGCATTPWVHRPAIDSVKKVAIVSVFSNQDIKGDRGSHADGQGIAAVGKIIGQQDPVKDNRIRVVAHTAQAYLDGLKKLGWKVFSPTAVAKTKAYKEFASNGFKNDSTIGTIARTISRVAQADLATLPEMVAINLNDAQFGTMTRNNLRELCKTLKVDALALIEAQLALDESELNLLVARSGRPQARTRLDVFTKAGDFAVRTPVINESKYFQAEKSVWSVNGTMKMNEEAEQRFNEAIDKSVAFITDRLAKELIAK